MIVSGAVSLGSVCLFRFFAFVIPGEWDPSIITRKIVPYSTVDEARGPSAYHDMQVLSQEALLVQRWARP